MVRAVISRLLAQFFNIPKSLVGQAIQSFPEPALRGLREAMDEAYETVSNESARADLELAKGAELRITSGLVSVIANDMVPSLGDTRYVLVEFRSDVIAERSMELIHELIVRDYQPIMAHPERNLSIQKNPKMLDDLRQAGLLFQLTAWCFDKSSRAMHAADKLAWKMLEDGYATVIASDAHNTSSRPPGLARAYDNVAARFGQSVVGTLIDNVNAIWENMPCYPLLHVRVVSAPIPENKKSE